MPGGGSEPAERKTAKVMTVFYLLLYTAVSVSVSTAGLLSGQRATQLNVFMEIWIILSICLGGVYLFAQSFQLISVPNDGDERRPKRRLDREVMASKKDVQFWGILLFGLGTLCLSVITMTEFWICSEPVAANSTEVESSSHSERMTTGRVLTDFAAPLMTCAFVVLELSLIKKFRMADFNRWHYLPLLHLVGTHLALWLDAFTDEIQVENVNYKNIGAGVSDTSEASAYLMYLHDTAANQTTNCKRVKSVLESVRPLSCLPVHYGVFSAHGRCHDRCMDEDLDDDKNNRKRRTCSNTNKQYGFFLSSFAGGPSAFTCLFRSECELSANACKCQKCRNTTFSSTVHRLR